MAEINGEFAGADETTVAWELERDVLNPAAREAEGTPIYGITALLFLNVDKCKEIFIFNYDKKTGLRRGRCNPIYTRKEGVHPILSATPPTPCTA